MDNANKSLLQQSTTFDEKNQKYVLKDAIGRKHVLIAGKDGVTEQWIALVRRDEYEERNSNHRYYFKRTGRYFEQRVFSSDVMPPEELEEFPSMSTPEDAPALLIAREEREDFLLEFRAAMQSLTPEQKQLIHKRVNLKMSDVEIAQQEGVSASAIHRRWLRVMKRLCKLLR